jgi:hypothetical protein
MMEISKGNDGRTGTKDTKDILKDRIMLQLVSEKHLQSKTQVKRFKVVEVDKSIRFIGELLQPDAFLNKDQELYSVEGRVVDVGLLLNQIETLLRHLVRQVAVGVVVQVQLGDEGEYGDEFGELVDFACSELH